MTCTRGPSLTVSPRAARQLRNLDPNDAAVSKYARGEPRDREWIRAGLGAALLSAPIIESRFRQTDFFDADEHERAIKALVEDCAKFGPALKSGRGKR